MDEHLRELLTVQVPDDDETTAHTAALWARMDAKLQPARVLRLPRIVYPAAAAILLLCIWGGVLYTGRPDAKPVAAAPVAAPEAGPSVQGGSPLAVLPAPGPAVIRHRKHRAKLAGIDAAIKDPCLMPTQTGADYGEDEPETEDPSTFGLYVTPQPSAAVQQSPAYLIAF